jgi:ribosomal protein S19E (S16A)
MPPKQNPLKLNPLQLRTLTVLQALTRVPGVASAGPGSGEVTVERFPQAHGDHFHLGDAVVATKDASGLYNEKVWHALERKGLARADWPHRITLTPDALQYDTGLAHEILHGASH